MSMHNLARWIWSAKKALTGISKEIFGYSFESQSMSEYVVSAATQYGVS